TQLGRLYFFFSSRRRHTRSKRDWSSDVCSSDLVLQIGPVGDLEPADLPLGDLGVAQRRIHGAVEHEPADGVREVFGIDRPEERRSEERREGKSGGRGGGRVGREEKRRASREGCE